MTRLTFSHVRRPLARHSLAWKMIGLGALLVLLGGLLNVGQPALAEGDAGRGSAGAGGSGNNEASLHPAIFLLDATGGSVLDSGAPVSTMATCGQCHDTMFIASHSFHTDVGLSSFGTAPAQGHPWDSSPGVFGRWNPITYRFLSLAGDAVPDLTTAEWIKTQGARHVGGGPAEMSRDGQPLLLRSMSGEPTSVETGILDPVSGLLIRWDWLKSGTVEMNCFLCHTGMPDNRSRIAALERGQFAWANSATLVGTGLIAADGDSFRWNRDAFDAEGRVEQATLKLQDPTNANCGQCHGTVHADARTPLTAAMFDPAAWSTYTTGQIVSPQRIANSALNLKDKELLSRSWDVHAERVVGCTDCHYSLNNPVFYQERGDDKPSHLVFDPRRLDISDYLKRPLHQFAKGSSAQGLLAPELNNTIRACESCHRIAATHNWLPYKERHVREVACETCHIPTLYAPALESVDWTVLQADATPRTRYRGVEGGQPSPDALITGFQPVLLTRTEADGTTALAPHNLVTAWYWVYGDPARPVPLHLLTAAWLVGDGPTRSYAPDVLAAFDADANGALSDAELFIDSDAKQDLIAGKLSAQGLANPRIASEVQPYGIHHDVARGEWAIRECQTCHTEQSRLEAPLTLADRLPGGVTPELSGMLQADGTLSVRAQGDLSFSLKTEGDGLHVFGNDRQNWIDTLGTLLFVGTFLGVLAHGGLRYITSRRRAPHAPNLRRVYMYSVYERQWHWLQTALIFILIFTGLVIHKPHLFGAFSFPFMVEVHNVTAILLLINAALAAFYHFASGEIKQFLPRPYGFFNHMFLQARYYVWGIFRGEDHPFAKSRERKMNPLQQVTYLMLLNVLLPLQVITGALMMGAQQWPDITQRLGGMPLLAPFHTAIAWALSSFIVLHVYLTTTGHTPTSNIQAMITGWDAVEAGQDGPGATPTSPALEPSQD